jgi:hypothetical protein
MMATKASPWRTASRAATARYHTARHHTARHHTGVAT